MKQMCHDYLIDQFGDEDVVTEIYNEYVSSLQGKLAEVETALKDGAWVDVDHIAHAIKGNALAAGDNPMAEVAIELRNSAKLSNAEDCRRLVDGLVELSKEL